jgi:hypothetical protein
MAAFNLALILNRAICAFFPSPFSPEGRGERRPHPLRISWWGLRLFKLNSLPQRRPRIRSAPRSPAGHRFSHRGAQRINRHLRVDHSTRLLSLSTPPRRRLSMPRCPAAAPISSPISRATGSAGSHVRAVAAPGRTDARRWARRAAPWYNSTLPVNSGHGRHCPRTIGPSAARAPPLPEGLFLICLDSG